LRWLEENAKEREKIKGCRVLELGAGTGILGLVLSACLDCKVVMTDLEEVLGNLSRNVSSNPLLPGCAGSVRVLPFDWNDIGSDKIISCGPFDLIVGTDVAYSETLNPVLLRCAASLARASEAASVIFVNELRCEIAQGVFDEEAPKYFRVSRVPPKRMHTDYKDANMIITRLSLKRSGEKIHEELEKDNVE